MTLEKRAKEREEFEDWLFVMDDWLEEFIDSFPEEIADKLDYSAASLDVLETWLLETYSHPKQLYDDKKTWDLVGRYIGQAHRKHLDGKWSVQLDDSELSNYGLPVIIAPRLAAYCPLTYGTAAIDRRRGDYLRTVLQNLKEMQAEEATTVM